MSARPGGTCTFYSYKGGVGRTMTLANVAVVLAGHGLRVLMIDWDLEAPGLHHYFRPLIVDPDVSSTDGLIDLLTRFEDEALTPQVTPSSDWHVRWVHLQQYTLDIACAFPGAGSLTLLPAGRQGPSYSRRVSAFDWDRYYQRFGGGVFLGELKRKLRDEFDYVLIDSRTGLGDSVGAAVVQMADDLVLCFAANSRALDGALTIAESVTQQRQGSAQGNVRIFPVPSRLELFEMSLLHEALSSARRSFAPFLGHLPDVDRYWSEVAVPYVPQYAFSEIPATLTEPPERSRLSDSAVHLATYLTSGQVREQVPFPASERDRIRALYSRRD